VVALLGSQSLAEARPSGGPGASAADPVGGGIRPLPPGARALAGLPWLKAAGPGPVTADRVGASALPPGAVEVAGLPWLATVRLKPADRQRRAGDGPSLSDRKALAPIEVASISDRDLAKMRGGFSFGAVDINFGLYTATAINGAVTQSFSFASNSATADAIAHLQQVVQSGPNNTAPGAFNFQGALSLIQNTLSNTVIQHITALSLDVAGVAGMKAHGSLSRAINNSLMLNF
jgi:hypothetical protein